MKKGVTSGAFGGGQSRKNIDLIEKCIVKLVICTKRLDSCAVKILSH